MDVFIILGNQIFDPEVFQKYKINKKNTIIFMREDNELATYYKFHKHKIIFFFAAMRSYRNELLELGFQVHYEEYQTNSPTYKNTTFEQALADFIDEKDIQNAFVFEIEDKFFEKRILKFFEKNKITLSVFQSPMFLTSRSHFASYLTSTKRPFMKTFYEWQRKRLNILIENNKPVGGVWSFDSENRLALPKDHKTPALPLMRQNEIVSKVSQCVDSEFSKHPGCVQDFWLPVNRKAAKDWLNTFLQERLYNFGPYEDAIPKHSEFLYHSVLTPFLNCGLLTPKEVIKAALSYADKKEIPLASLEGFIRQVIGWREFIRGIYQNYSEYQETKNFWGHSKKLTSYWYHGNTGIPPLDETIRRVLKNSYAHHIERLMILGNLMLLLEVDPWESYKWFMEMFIDSSDWVMGPNVFGMALFSDGGLFATKPYICGSNYLRKMGGYDTGEWCDGVDGLYWQFIKKHKSMFVKNPRLSMMVKAVEKISKDRWSVLEKAAQSLREKLVE